MEAHPLDDGEELLLVVLRRDDDDAGRGMRGQLLERHLLAVRQLPLAHAGGVAAETGRVLDHEAPARQVRADHLEHLATGRTPRRTRAGSRARPRGRAASSAPRSRRRRTPSRARTVRGWAPRSPSCARSRASPRGPRRAPGPRRRRRPADRLVFVDQCSVDVERDEQTFAGRHLADRLEHVETAEVGPERLGHDHRAVGALVRLEDRHDPARGRERAVEGGDRRGLAALGAVADVEPSRLERRAVRGRRELAVRVLGRHPRFDVELAGGARAEVAGRHVDDPVAEAEGLQHLLLPGDEAVVLGLGVLRERVDEHLELVELVHPDDAAGVLAARAGLAAVAGRPAGVADRAVGQVEDLVGVVAGERDLAGAGEVEVVGRQVVDLVGVGAEEAGALHDLRLDQGRRDQRREACGERPVERHVHERDLEAGDDALQVVEARAGDLRAARHVDAAEQLADLEVVAGFEVEGRLLADRAQRDEVLFASGGHAVDDRVAERADGETERLLRLVRGLLRRLHPRREVLRLGDECFLLVLRRGGDLLAEQVLLGTQLLERGDRRATLDVGEEGGVDEC